MKEPEQQHEPSFERALARALERVGAGVPFRETFEELLRDLEPAQADALMLCAKESRGAWALFAAARAGPVLFVGNALSGTVTALAVLGFDVVVADERSERVRFALARDRALAGGRARGVCARPEALPFADASFPWALAELPGGRAGSPAVLSELARVARDELGLVADNRLAYKRSTGRRGRFHVPGPLEWLGRALRPPRGERLPASYARALEHSGLPRAHAFALYPDAREFSHVVALDRPRPRLTIGPKERANRLKLLARRAGLFPLLTPSLALIGRRRPAEPRIARVLATLAERIGEPVPELDVLIASRSNLAVLLTRAQEAGEARGAWCVHVPLGPHKGAMVRRHFAFLQRLRREFPAVPVPEPLFLGEVEGLLVSCERRLAGSNAAQLTGAPGPTARFLSGVRRHLAALVVAPPAPFDEERFEALVERRFRLAQSRCAVPVTAARIERLLAEARERLVGARFPLVLYHADLRAKHVAVEASGEVAGYLDWGTAEEAFLPYVDLFHLVAHQRKQQLGGTSGEAWRDVLDRSVESPERDALAGYAADLDLPEELVATVEACHPLFVAGMAERNWDYSRPRWLHAQFGL